MVEPRSVNLTGIIDMPSAIPLRIAARLDTSGANDELTMDEALAFQASSLAPSLGTVHPKDIISKLQELEKKDPETTQKIRRQANYMLGLADFLQTREYSFQYGRTRRDERIRKVIALYDGEQTKTVQMVANEVYTEHVDKGEAYPSLTNLKAEFRRRIRDKVSCSREDLQSKEKEGSVAGVVGISVVAAGVGAAGGMMFIKHPVWGPVIGGVVGFGGLILLLNGGGNPTEQSFAGYCHTDRLITEGDTYFREPLGCSVGRGIR